MHHHTPVSPLFSKKGKHVGYVCRHCDGLFTTAMRPSEPMRYLQTNPSFGGRFVKSKAHAERVAAAKRLRRRAKTGANRSSRKAA